MKLTQYNTSIFVSMIQELTSQISQVETQAKAWLDVQEKREKGWGVDSYRAQSIRIALESQLNDLRERLASVYDFQGDRGMADFVPAGFNNDEPEEEVKKEEDEEDGYDPFDFSFFPKEQKKEEKKIMLAWPNPYARVSSTDSATVVDEAS